MRWHVGDVVAADEHPALVELLQPGHGPQGRGLAAAGWPEQGHQLAWRDGDREVVESVHFVEGAPAVDEVDGDHRCGRRGRRSPPGGGG